MVLLGPLPGQPGLPSSRIFPRYSLVPPFIHSGKKFLPRLSALLSTPLFRLRKLVHKVFLVVTLNRWDVYRALCGSGFGDGNPWNGLGNFGGSHLCIRREISC